VFNVSGPELLVVLLVALIVLGPEKLPEMARKIGNITAELRRISNGFQAEVRDAFQEPMQGFRDVYNGTVTEAPPATPATPAIEATASEAAAPDGVTSAAQGDVPTSEPEAQKPDELQDHTAQPEANAPAVARPDTQPETQALDVAQPETRPHDEPQPEMQQPEVQQPDVQQPVAHRPPDPTPWSG